MNFSWDENLATGNTVIDGQHKQLIEALGRLSTAREKEDYVNELFRSVEFLNAYVIKHFSDEEKLQVESNYPEYLRHWNYHNEFKILAAQLAQRLVDEGPDDELVDEVIDIIGNWLINHIKGDDFHFAAHLRTLK